MWVPRHNIEFFLAGASAGRDCTAQERGQAALADLERIRRLHPPEVEAYSDGGAIGGRSCATGGARVVWADGEETWESAAAGSRASSTTAEASGAGLALSLVQLGLEARPAMVRSALWLLFDSRALFQRLQRPWCSLGDSTSISLVRRLQHLDSSFDIKVIWIPGHAGIDGNEHADRAANAGRALSQEAVPLAPEAVASFLKEQSAAEWARRYSSGPQNTHFQLTGGVPLPTGELSREEATTLFRLRVDRAPFALGTLARFGRAESAFCPCGSGEQDSLHILLDCPNFSTQRREIFAEPPEASLIKNPAAQLRFLRRSGLLRAPGEEEDA